MILDYLSSMKVVLWSVERLLPYTNIYYTLIYKNQEWFEHGILIHANNLNLKQLSKKKFTKKGCIVDFHIYYSY